MTYRDMRRGWGNARSLGAAQPPAIEGGTAPAVDPVTFRDQAQKTVFAAQGEVEQAWGQLSQAAQAGLDDQTLQLHQVKLQQLSDNLKALQNDAANVTRGGDMQAWQARAQATVEQAHDELNTVVRLNRGAIEGGGLKGLLWGLGVAAAVATAGYLVWRKKSRRRG